MRESRRVFLFLAAIAVMPAMLEGQAPSFGPPAPIDQDQMARDMRIANPRGIQIQKPVGGRVSTLQGDPVVKASVGIENNAGLPYRVVQTDGQGEFRSDYYFFEETEAVKHFTVTLKVSKKGFHEAHRIVEIPDTNKVPGIPVTLRPIRPEDPNLLSQAELFNNLAPRLRELGPAEGLSPKDEKDYARGVRDFLDRNHPDRAVPVFSKVASRNPSCLKCRTMLALAELSWGDWDDAQHELGECIKALIANQQLGSPEPLLAYGVMASWDHKPQKASAFFAEALKYAPDDTLALQELGRAQCQSLLWKACSESLKKALNEGASPELRLRLAEALIWSAAPDEANTELTRYLNGRDLKSMPPQVRALSGRILERKKDEAVLQAAEAKARTRGEEPLDYIQHPPQNLPDFQPAVDQFSLDAILLAVGRNVSQSFSSLPNISAVENIHQEKLSRSGKPRDGQEHEYRYFCLTPTGSWGPSVEEYRSNSQGNETGPSGVVEGFMRTAGFVSAPLVFHPAYQNGSAFRLLGRQTIKGRGAFVIAYAQDPAKSRTHGTFQDGKLAKVTYEQGLVWIDSESYQILRVISDLLKPLPQIKLKKLTTEIVFSEVHFSQGAQNIWLPSEVTVTLDWRGNNLRNKHVYSDFLLFNVEFTQRFGKLQAAGKAAEDASGQARGDNPLDNLELTQAPRKYKP